MFESPFLISLLPELIINKMMTHLCLQVWSREGPSSLEGGRAESRFLLNKMNLRVEVEQQSRTLFFSAALCPTTHLSQQSPVSGGEGGNSQMWCCP